MDQHHFRLTANWDGGRNGVGALEIGNLKSAISAPKELDGPGTGTNPEEMLMGAAATCYLITLAAILEKRALPVRKLTMETEGIVSTVGGTHFEQIIHHPHIVLAADATEEQVETANAAILRAEKACMISKALSGNVEVKAIPTVTKE
ncbi:SACOL1771 family peroxiredoxin [Fodinisporobacter ferrooxydans]|uniref:SACOL1771 family peroxiredoxin n=1 Tax=Fodinisporobacter ferrooxydans TaxID=2901836 RepID=A0ABY4CPL2_9BACL|nr:SACOL1771 family peroxiredoxin [Alicyclobacillaceae bacterium MYW30-H2]